MHEQILIDDLRKNKPIYMSEKVRDIIGIEEYSKFEQLYEDFSVAIKDYETKKSKQNLAKCYLGQAYREEQKNKKKNPYIAGAIGEIIGGPGVGIYAAMSTAERNKEIEEKGITNTMNHWTYASDVDKATKEVISAEKKLMTIVRKINTLLDNVPEVREYIEQEKKQKNYEEWQEKRNKKKEENKAPERRKVILFIRFTFILLGILWFLAMYQNGGGQFFIGGI